MQSDTIIGIVGAVVLVAVMIGVFAYEYNNTPATGDDGDGATPTERMAAFNATYPTLAAEDDLDGDGTPNWQDDDIDGDDTDNGNDTTIAVTFDLSQSAPANTNAQGAGPASSGEDFILATGFTAFTIDVSHGTGQLGTFRAQAQAGDAGQCTTGQDGTCAIEGGAEVATGEYTLTVRQTAINNSGMQVTVTATVTYG